MKIAILSCFHPYRGGIAQFNASIFNELSKGYDVRAFNFKRQYPEFLFPGKTQYITEDDTAVPIESTALLDTANPFSYAKTATEINSWGPDILLMRYWMPYFGPSLGYVARRMRPECKVIPILDNVIPHEQRFFDKAFTKYFLKGCDGFITMCNEVDYDLHAFIPGAKSITIPHPLYSHFGEKMERREAEKILGLDGGKKTLLFFGLIREYKGLDILLEAFKMLPDDYQLLIAGEPYGSFEKYEKIIDSTPGKERIHLFTNYIADKDVRTFFSASDITVLPYRSATQSGISSISYHFEIPMIVTDVGGLKETVGLRGTGLLAKKADPESIKEEIEKYFGNELIREECINNIRKEKQRLSWHNFCENLMTFAKTI